MAGHEFLKSIEVNYKKAVECLQKTEGKEVYSDELAGQIMMANSTYVVRFGVRLRGTIYTFTGYIIRFILKRGDLIFFGNT